MIGEIDLLLISSFCFVLQAANNSSLEQQGAVGESNVQTNCSDGGGITELEKLLKQKTFTRHVLYHVHEESFAFGIYYLVVEYLSVYTFERLSIFIFRKGLNITFSLNIENEYSHIVKCSLCRWF